MITGYGLGFEAPSYASFLRGLRHAMYPKDLSNCPSVQNPWPCFGRIQNLFVDNALHFIGDNIREAGRELGFNVPRFHAREPWAKGALERFFRSFNTGLVHSLPATTHQNANARKDHEHLGGLLSRLRNSRRFWFTGFVTSITSKKRRALGPIRGVGDVLLRVWSEKGKNFVTPLLPPEDMFVTLAGDWEMRVIGKDGVVWDYIKYEDAVLYSIISHPDYSKGMKYKIVRDPMNLGCIMSSIIIMASASKFRRRRATMNTHPGGPSTNIVLCSPTQSALSSFGKKTTGMQLLLPKTNWHRLRSTF